MVNSAPRSKEYGRLSLGALVTHRVVAGLNELDAFIGPDNEPARKCLHAFGFAQVGSRVQTLKAFRNTCVRLAERAPRPLEWTGPGISIGACPRRDGG